MGTRLLEFGGISLVINQSVVSVELESSPKDRSCLFRCLLFKVIFFILSMLYIEHCLLILPLFVAICDIWLSGLTYGVYLVLFSANVIKSVVSSTTTRHGELKINLCLSYQRLQIINPRSLHLINLESKKHEDLKMSFLFLRSLFESRDEIPVKWGSLSHPKISNFGLCIENTK